MDPTLAAIMHDWAGAAAVPDVRALDAILDDDFVGISPIGKTETKADYLAQFKGIGPRKVTVDELSSRIYGDVAIVFGRSTQDYGQGNPPKILHTRYSDVFVKRGNAWKCVSAHGSRIS